MSDHFRDALQQFAIECEQSLGELEAEHEARRQQVVRSLSSRAVARLAASLGDVVRPSQPVRVDMATPRQPSEVGLRERSMTASSDQTQTLSTGRTRTTRILTTTGDGSPCLVESVLEDGRCMHTLEPPRMVSTLESLAGVVREAARPVVPMLDMSKVKPELSSLSDTLTGSQDQSTAASTATARAYRSLVPPPMATKGLLADEAPGTVQPAFSAGPKGAGVCLEGSPTPPTPPDAAAYATDVAAEVARAERRRLAVVAFDCAAAALTLGNAAALGVETSYLSRGLEAPEIFFVLEAAFLGALAVELVVRAMVPNRALLSEGGCVFDFSILIYGVAHIVLARALRHRPVAETALKFLRLLRWLRLIRLWHALRHFALPRLLCQAALTALAPGLWVLAFVAVALWVFAAVGMEFITPSAEHGEEYEEAVELYFDTLGDSLLSLLSAVTLDGATSICAPLIAARPLLAVYFSVLLAGIPFAAASLATAIAVHSLARCSGAATDEAWQQWEAAPEPVAGSCAGSWRAGADACGSFAQTERAGGWS